MENLETITTPETVAETTPTVDFDALLKNPDFTKKLNSFVDSKTTQAIKTYKEQGFATAVEKEVDNRLKARETKTPEQIRLEETEAKLNVVLSNLAEKERTEMRLKNKDTARSLLTEAKVPDDILDFIVDADGEKTKDNVSKVLEIFTKFKTNIVQTEFSNNNITVPSTKKVGNGNNKEPAENASKEEWMSYFRNTKK
jgi:hypothetical protein